MTGVSEVEDGGDVHALDPESFRQEVQSFEFWFDSVRGYLGGLHHGRHAETPENPHFLAPLVESGHVRFVVPHEAREAFEQWERKMGIAAGN